MGMTSIKSTTAPLSMESTEYYPFIPFTNLGRLITFQLWFVPKIPASIGLLTIPKRGR